MNPGTVHRAEKEHENVSGTLATELKNNMRNAREKVLSICEKK